MLCSINASALQQRQDGPTLLDGRTPRKGRGLPIVVVNLVGANDGIIFDGASIVADCRGEIIMQAPPFEEFFGTSIWIAASRMIAACPQRY